MLIIGAKGFAKELLEIFLQQELNSQIAFYDDISQDLSDVLFGKYQIVRNEEEAKRYFAEKDANFALGVGSPNLRHDFTKSLKS